jgi:hypothetical protein
MDNGTQARRMNRILTDKEKINFTFQKFCLYLSSKILAGKTIGFIP